MRIIVNNFKERFTIDAIIEERLAYLQPLLSELETEYVKMPEGNLLVLPGKTENLFRYYVRKSQQDKYGEYLDKTRETDKVVYSRKKYLSSLIKNIKDEISKLEKIKGMNISDSIIDTYQDLNLGVFKKTEPLNIDDETYIQLWQNEPYEGLEFDENDKTSYYSEKNERMRSKSEVWIANTLNRLGIPYKYECPVEYSPGKFFYPDFTILDVRRRKIKYWEHLGRMGDASYVSKNAWKLEEYKKADIYLGINLFVSTESNINGLGTNEIMKVIESIIG